MTTQNPEGGPVTLKEALAFPGRPPAELLPLPERVKDCVSYHAPTPLDIAKIGEVREKVEALILTIVANCPSSPDRSAAIRHAREAMMTANAAIMVPTGSTIF